MIQKKLLRKNIYLFFFENCAAYGTVWINMVQPDMPLNLLHGIESFLRS